MTEVSGKWFVVISLLSGTFTIVLNNSMLNPAVPYLMDVFHTDAVKASWVITIFMVMMGITLPLTGYLGDKFGKKNMFITGLILFVIASIFGSFSWSMGSFIFFRSLQGIAGGIIMPISMTLIFETFPRKERGKAMGVWGICVMLAPAIGPTIGGLIMELGSWKFLFLVNIPIGLMAVVLSYIYLPQTPRKKDIYFDIWGFLCVTIGIGTILFSLGNISTLDHLFNPLNVLLVLAGIVFLSLFLQIEKRATHPLLDLSIFRIGAYSYSVCVAGISAIGMFSGVFLVPLLIQQVYGYGPIMSGLALLPAALFSGIFINIGGRVLDRRGATWIITTGVTILSLGTISMYFLEIDSALVWVFILMAIRGIGLGLSGMTASTVGMNTIPSNLVSSGAAMNNVLRQMSSALGIVFVSIYYEVRVTQMFTNMPVQEAQFIAINEGFLIIGIITALLIPAGYMLGKKAKETEARIDDKKCKNLV
ncbi:MFS transporter [Alkalihalophilus pseudofirmus]|nr:MFS transporter [Alkalihalophilus pseudofirmus]